MLLVLSLFSRLIKRIIKGIGMLLLTLFVMFSSIGTSLFIIYELDMSHFLGPFGTGIDRFLSRIILGVLPVGRAGYGQGPWAESNPILDLFNSVLKPNYDCPVNLDPSIFNRAAGSALALFGPMSSSFTPVFILIHFVTCGLIVVLVGPRLRRTSMALYGCMKDTSKVSLYSNFSKIIMLSAVLSIIWPIVSKIIWGTWWEYSVLIYQRYTVILTHDQDGLSAGIGVNPYGDGAATGWFGYYGVFAGVFLSYVLTVLWSAKFVIGRAVRREAALIRGEGFSNEGDGAGSEIERDGVDNTSLSAVTHRGRRWMWRVGIGLLILMLYGWPLVVGWVGRILPDDIWMKWVPY